MVRFSRLLATLAIVSGLAACGHVPVSTMVQMRKFDPATFDPAPVRIAVRMTDQIEPLKGSAVFRMTLTMIGRTPETVRQGFILEPVPVASEPALDAFRKPGQAIHIFRFTAADSERIRALQREMAEQRAKGTGRGRLQIDVSSKACRKAALPPGPLVTTTLIRTDAQGPFLVLLKDVDLRAEAAQHGAGLEADIPPCE